MLNMVPIMADRMREEDCTGGDGRLLFFFASSPPSQILLVRSFDLTGTLPVGFVSDRWINPVTRLRLRA
jgi:hypothetical protein